MCYVQILVQVLGTFRDLEESNILSPHMSDAVKEVSRACQAFEAKESAPPIAGMIRVEARTTGKQIFVPKVPCYTEALILEIVLSSCPLIAVTVLRTLEFEISKIYILRLCSWMRSSIQEISKDESWVPVSILERNKSPYSISSLPLAFRAVMISAMDQINE